MKNLKKVLALVLAFACAFTMFAGAVVYPDVPAGSEFSEAISFLSDLGIIQGKDDGKYHAEDSITRAEACALIARMLTGDPDVSKFAGASNFTDVAKGSWKESAIGYCVVNGITVGVGNGKFEPDRAITDAEFVTMVVRAMGYETTGTTYPYGHISAAQANGLLDGVSVVPTSAALRGEDAQIMFNAMFADYARGAKMVNQTHGTTVEEYDTIAHAVWGLERAAVGTYGKNNDTDEEYMKTCKAHTWVVVDRVNDKDNTIRVLPIEDGATDLYADGAKKGNNLYYTFKYDGDIEAIKGYQVELYGEGQHSEAELETITDPNGDKVKVYASDWEIKAIKTVKGQTAYDYNPSMADSKPENGEIELDETTLDLVSAAENYKILNWTHWDTDEDIETELNHKEGDQYKLFDWDSDGDVDFITQDIAHYYLVEDVTSKKLVVSYLEDRNYINEDANNRTETWKIDGINEDKNGFKVEYTGADAVEKGDIVEVTYTTAYNSSEKEAVKTCALTVVEPETKELSKVSTKGELQLTFDGEVIDIAEGTEYADLIAPENPDTYADFKEEELGTNFALYLDRNGFIVYSKYADEDTAKYAMVLDTADGRNTAPRSLAQVDLLMADNSIQNGVEVASDLDIYEADGRTPVSNAYNEEETGTKAGRFFDESQVVGNVYKVYMNDKGIITKMVELMDDDTMVSATGYQYNEKLDRLSATGMNRNASLEGAKALFIVETNDDVATNEKAGYIKWDDKTNQDNQESGLYVDRDLVRAVSVEDMPNIGNTGDLTQPKNLDVNVNDEKGDSSSMAGWFTAATNTTTAKLLLEKNKNDEVSAAILAVNTLDYFTNGSVKPVLLTFVEASGKGDSRQITMDMAVDGKFQTGVEAVTGKDVDDIFDYASLNMLEGAIGNGIYAEATFNEDGKVTDVKLMNTVSGDDYKGDFYTVKRKAVAQVEGKWFSTFNTAYFASDKTMYTIGRTVDTQDTEIDGETVYYSIDARPSAENKNYNNRKMTAQNGFEDVLATYKGGELKSTKLNESEVGSEVLVSSYVNNKQNDVDEYAVADVIVKNGDNYAVAVFAYEDTMEEVDGNTVGITLAPVAVNDTETATINQVASQSLNVNSVSFFDGTTSVGFLSATGLPSNTTFTVNADNTAVPGTYKGVAYDAAGNELATFDVKVVSAAPGSYTTTLYITPVGTAGEGRVKILIDLPARAGSTEIIVNTNTGMTASDLAKLLAQQMNQIDGLTATAKGTTVELTAQHPIGITFVETGAGFYISEQPVMDETIKGDKVEDAPANLQAPAADKAVEEIEKVVSGLNLNGKLPTSDELDSTHSANKTDIVNAIVALDGFSSWSGEWGDAIEDDNDASQKEKAAKQYLDFMNFGFVPHRVDLSDLFNSLALDGANDKYVLVQSNPAFGGSYASYWETHKEAGVKVYAPMTKADLLAQKADMDFVSVNGESVTFEVYYVGEGTGDLSTEGSLANFAVVGTVTIEIG